MSNFIITLLICFVSYNAYAANPLNDNAADEHLSTKPVNFTAETLSHDDEAQKVTASGDVELIQGNKILRADKILYYLAEDKVEASGNVSLLDEDGNVFFAQELELTNNMKDGFIKQLLALLSDGSRFTAKQIKREKNGTFTTMQKATYTACKVCEADPNPLWQIKASQITYDTEEKEVKYKNARMELLGIPFIYSPIFSHPDPSIKRKSGLLRPEYGWTKSLGGYLTAGYYYNVSPDNDFTFEVMPTSQSGTLFEGEWRKRFTNGQIEFNASTAKSDRTKETGVSANNVQRGHFSIDGEFDINNKWRTGFDITRTSDKQYLRLYDIIDEDVFNNEIYAERFSGRNYSRISALNFQDVRLGIRPDQPNVLPMMEHTMIGEPNSLWGGRWKNTFSLLGLARPKNNGQDVQRASVELGWERRGISSIGLVNTLNINGRGDFYSINDSNAAKINPAQESNLITARSIATASLISSYPLIKPMSEAKAIIEPIAGVSISPKVNKTNDKIPNEDSIDIRFDNSNLFEQNKYPGVDRQEDGGRLNFGLKTGVYGDNGRYGRAFFGQSYRFYGDHIFPAGSGLEGNLSDFVGQIKVGLSDYLDADYRFQIDNANLKAKRHELQASGGNNIIHLNSRYIYMAAVAGTGFIESREQVQIDGTYNINKNWQLESAGLLDIGDQPGLRYASAGINYADECFTFSIKGVRNIANDASGENDTSLMVRIGLRNIGEFTGPEITLGGNREKK